MYTNSVKHIRIQKRSKTCIIRKFVVHLQSLILIILWNMKLRQPYF